VQFDVDDLARRLRAQLVGASEDGQRSRAPLTVDGLAIDSRLVSHGQMFAAIRGGRDGHDFVEAAFAAGAAAVLVERVPLGGAAGPSLVVTSVPDALADLARVARDRLSSHGAGVDRVVDRVVGVTGSVGKTTTKDLLAAVLGRRFSTAASEKSFNNELGVPLTLVNAPDGTEAAVIEMGARGAGHIRALCEMARPTVGVITVVEGVHTEVMGTIEQIAAAKRELVEHLPADGAAVLNADDPNVAAMAAHTVAAVVTFGSDGEVHAGDIAVDDELRPSFVLHSAWGSAAVRLGARGVHNVTNALAASAAGLWLGVEVEEVASGLAEPPASPWRMELRRVPGGSVVLNDAYNAGPASMAAALEALASLALPDGGRRIAVLGVMAELGSEGPGAHRRITELAEELGVEVLAVGCDLYGASWSVGVTDDVATDDVVTEVTAALGDLGPGDAVLVKGSRVAGLERVAEALTRRDR